MSNPITDDLARVRELNAKSTKGPMRAYTNGGIYKEEDSHSEKVAECFQPHLAILFAEYRTLAPRLADEIERLRAENVELRERATTWEAKAWGLEEVIENAKCAFGEHPESDIDLADRISELRDAARKPFHEGTESMREKDALRADLARAREALTVAMEELGKIEVLDYSKAAINFAAYRAVQLAKTALKNINETQSNSSGVTRNGIKSNAILSLTRQNNMKTYMQEHRFNGVFDPGINWHRELDVRINGGRPEYTDKKLKDLADDWVTCGVGNQCNIIPRESNGAPEDFKLMRLGFDFNNVVDMEEWGKALAILEKIEARSQELIVDIRVGYLPVSMPPILI